MGTADTVNWAQSGRTFSAQEIGQIRETVGWLPGLAQRELAATVCEHLHWHTLSGTPKLQACQKLLARMAAAGLLELPASRRKNNHSGDRAVVALSARTASERLLACPLQEVEPVRLEVVAEASEVGLWNEYVERFHPLGYKGAFGYRLRYFIRSGAQRLGCVLLCGAAKAIAVRERWIGWNEPARLYNLPRVVNNSRFLIFPHVRIPHLASHVLGQLARRVTADWQRQWGFTPLLMETFVDPSRYGGTCYRAAGWELLGRLIHAKKFRRYLLKALYAALGVRATIAFIRQSCAAPWLDPARILTLLSQPFHLQLEGSTFPDRNQFRPRPARAPCPAFLQVRSGTPCKLRCRHSTHDDWSPFWLSAIFSLPGLGQRYPGQGSCFTAERLSPRLTPAWPVTSNIRA